MNLINSGQEPFFNYHPVWKLYGQTYEEANVMGTEGKRWITAWAEQQLPHGSESTTSV